MKKVVIWGVGQGGQMMKNLLSPDMKVVAYCDNNKKMQGTKIGNIPVINEQQLLDIEPDYVYIAILNKDACKEVKLQIEALALKCSIISITEYRQQLDIRLAVLKLIAREVEQRNIQGDVAELGVYKGKFAAEINALFPKRNIYLFDTFEGFDERDIEIEKKNEFSRSEIGKFNDTSIDMVSSRLPYKEQAIFKNGYFPDTAHGIDVNFAVVSLDADLYQPIYEGLKFFYPRMSVGGYMIIHDYNNTQFSGVREAVQQFCREENVFVVPICDLHGTAVIVKQ
ncbi:TylF/MycF/NovP-related O-methyltransferase [Clostridium coskatii]|uniref:Demethyldecarbamoylnovobiocin O-methyltransferase n=1 Tax=Clostridium coskatii TaxID=1705578 RepID=A0A166SVX3_9CLOT|nr:TylF/MycF/NovP-related O-methyltransferase [Clostridium coskatii]OAA92841.1 Demethyldecarbamoylnovobiocin O-methyltransferase [Clostridium coskatii]OBR95783.1 demethyldecarbamoylnovobiocin O-methyltransferase [Clostridium coskatii]